MGELGGLSPASARHPAASIADQAFHLVRCFALQIPLMRSFLSRILYDGSQNLVSICWTGRLRRSVAPQEVTMAIGIVFDGIGVTREQYEQVNDQVSQATR